jgi:amidase
MIAVQSHDGASDLARCSASRLAALIRAKKASAVEALDAHVARIERLNPVLNAVVTLDLERAQDQARAHDRALARGDSCGPLHGVPFTLKAHHETAGVETSLGIHGSARVPEQDGVIAARLKANGAILIGKTNMAMSVQTVSELHGRTNNPYDLARTVGGSSGGAAAAVAAGLTSFDVGSDASGSIRMPAHFCGVFGFKTTLHRIPSVGLGLSPPGTPRLDRVLGVTGPIARSLEDVALVLEVLCGPDPRDPESPPVPLGSVPRREPKSLRLAVAPSIQGVAAEREQTRALMDLAAELDRAGATVELCEPPVSFAELLEASRRYYPVLLDALGKAGLAPPTQLPVGEAPSVFDLFASLSERDAISARLEGFLEAYDGFLCPVSIGTAFEHRPRSAPIAIDGELISPLCVDHPCLLASYTGLPALSIPVGLDSRGLPIGAQLVGRRWHDANLIGVAHAIAAVAGPLPPPGPSASSA